MAVATAAAADSKGSRLRTRREAAEYLGLAENTLARWASLEVNLPFIKLGGGRCGRVRYRQADLDSYLEAQTVAPGNAGEL